MKKQIVSGKMYLKQVTDFKSLHNIDI